VQERIGSKKTIKEIPREQSLPLRPKLAEIFNGEITKKLRDEQIQKAHFQHGYLLKEIAEYLNIHYSTVSRIINSK
jgi:DNA invertase Pin-like site-specific DNA recombinase